MKKIAAYPLSLCFYAVFGGILCFFHPILWVAHKISAKKLDQGVSLLNYCLIKSLLILGTRVSIDKPDLEKGQSYIIVANHQSTFDIPPMLWYLKELRPKFISKKELGKGIPSVSLNLKRGGSVLINRKDPLQSVKAIRNFSKNTYRKGYSAVIFPEGTRSKNGIPKKFRTNGLKVLLENMPNAQILPISINHSWKTMQYGNFPMGIGVHIHLKIHAPIAIKRNNADELIKQTESLITKHVLV